MKLDQDYVKRSEAIEHDLKSTISLYGYIGKQMMPEGDDFESYLKSKGIAFEKRDIRTVGTWEDIAHELYYHHPEQGERYGYLLNHRSDIDVFYQDVYVFTQPVPDDQLVRAIQLIEQQEDDLNQIICERQKEIDREYSPYWRQINYNWQMSVMAYHLYKYGWTAKIEALLQQWGSYNTKEGIGLENALVDSLLLYSLRIIDQEDPLGYILGLLKKAGRYGRAYKNLV